MSYQRMNSENWKTPAVSIDQRSLTKCEVTIDPSHNSALVNEKLEFNTAVRRRSSESAVNNATCRFSHGLGTDAKVVKCVMKIIDQHGNHFATYEGEVKEKNEAIKEYRKRVQNESRCFMAGASKDMFRFEFGAVDPEHTIHVDFSYYMPFEDNNVLRLPISFVPTLTLNPGEQVPDNTAAQNAFNLTVNCPGHFSRVTNMGDDMVQDMADGNRFILHNQNKLNVELRFFRSQDEGSMTDGILCDLSVPYESELNGKVAAVIDHKINCNYTQLDQCELHFAIDCSDKMNGSKPDIKRALLDVVDRLGSQSLKVSVSCFGERNMETWRSEMGNLEQWLTTTMINNFGPYPEIAKYLGQIYSDLIDQAYCPGQVILLTNAAPMNYDDIIRVASNARTTEMYHNRTFTIGVDKTVSQGLCKKIANTLGGKALFCSTFADIAEQLRSHVASAQLKSNLKLKSFQATLLNATANHVAARTYSDCGLGTELDNITLFDGNGDVEAGSLLTDKVTHIRAGFLFDTAPTTGFLSVKVKVILEVVDSGITVPTSEDLSIPFAATPNAVFYSYIHEALNRRIKLRHNDESLQQSIIDLSRTMRVLCERTCFCYVRSKGRPRIYDRDNHDRDAEAPVKQRPRYDHEHEETFQISYGLPDMNDLHGNGDNLQLDPLDRDGGGNVFLDDRQRPPTRPAGHMETSGHTDTKPSGDFHIDKLAEQIRDVKSLTHISGLLKKTQGSDDALTNISGRQINIADDWKLLDEWTTEILQRGDDSKNIPDDWKQTLLSIAFFHLFCHNHQNLWKNHSKRPIRLLYNQTRFNREVDLEDIIDRLKTHYNL